LNEKVMCGLGRGIAHTGRLNRDGVELAYANVQRFVALARALAVDHLAIIATAAVREARDGADFAAAIERLCGVPVRVIDGAEEARLSAAGVLAGIPEADGIVGDLGGGSVELVRVDGGNPDAPIGTGVTLPLGPLRLARFGDNQRAIAEAIDRAAAEAAVLREAAGRSLYLVGGAWRAIARLHMEQAHYPLHIIHHYTIARPQAEAFCDLVSRLSRRSLERITTINRKRLEVVPLAAMILRRLLAVGRPERVIFSAFGLREGYAYGRLPPEDRGDPLLAACIGMATEHSRSRSDGELMQVWTAPLFPGLSPAGRRLAQRHRLDRASRLPGRARLHPQPAHARGGARPCRAGVHRLGAACPLRRGAGRSGAGRDPAADRRARGGRGPRSRPRAAPRLHAVRRRPRPARRGPPGARRRQPGPRHPAVRQPVPRRGGAAPPRRARPRPRAAGADPPPAQPQPGPGLTRKRCSAKDSEETQRTRRRLGAFASSASSSRPPR